MKKHFIKIAFVAVFATIAGYGVYTSQKSETLSDLALANVEALANSEWGQGFNCRWYDSGYWLCLPSGGGLGCPCYM